MEISVLTVYSPVTSTQTLITIDVIRVYCIQSGKVYLTTSFLCFTSLDRRSCRTTLALCTIRRVEKLPAGVGGGAMALSIGLWEGGKIILGLNGLRGSCDQVSYSSICT